MGIVIGKWQVIIDGDDFPFECESREEALRLMAAFKDFFGVIYSDPNMPMQVVCNVGE